MRPWREAAQLTLAHLHGLVNSGSVEESKVFVVYPGYRRADIQVGSWIKWLKTKEVPILLNGPLLGFIYLINYFKYLSPSWKKTWHSLNFYNTLVSPVRRTFSSLGAKSRKMRCVFRQLNKRLSFHRQQYPPVLITARRDSNLASERMFSSFKTKTFLVAKQFHRKFPTEDEGQKPTGKHSEWFACLGFSSWQWMDSEGFRSNRPTVIKGLMMCYSSLPLQWSVEAKLLPVEIRNLQDSQCSFLPSLALN